MSQSLLSPPPSTVSFSVCTLREIHSHHVPYFDAPRESRCRYTGLNPKIQISDFLGLFGVVRGYIFASFLHCILLKTSSFSDMEVLLDWRRQDLFKKALKLQSLSHNMSLHTDDPLMGTLTR